MHVVSLHGELDDAHAKTPRGLRERTADDRERATASEVVHVLRHPQRHVDWMRTRELRALRVRDAGALARRLAPRSLALSASRMKAKVELPCSPHHWLGIVYNYRHESQAGLSQFRGYRPDRSLKI